MEAAAIRKEETTTHQGFVQLRDIFSPNSPLLSTTDVTKFLNELCRSLDEGANKVAQSFSGDMHFMTATEAKVVFLCLHLEIIETHWVDGVDCIDNMLFDQLVAAIGKVVEVSDFDQLIAHHFRKMFSTQYVPRTFCYAIRRPKQDPCGILSIEHVKDDIGPIQTLVRVFPETPLIQMPINAATTVEMHGPV